MKHVIELLIYSGSFELALKRETAIQRIWCKNDKRNSFSSKINHHNLYHAKALWGGGGRRSLP